MKSALNRFSMFAIKAQKYLPVLMMGYAVFIAFISPLTPDSGGGTGR
jgi:hypothetical protein